MFKLLRYFSITSFVAILIVTPVLAMLYRYVALNDLVELGQRNNIALTQMFSNTLWPEFGPFLTSTSGLGNEELRGRGETARLQRGVRELMQGLSVAKVKVYDLAGRTVFSTEAKQIGEDKSKNGGFLSARSGKVANEITRRDTFSAFDGIIENRDLISSYVPIRRSGSAGTIEAVFELYYDVTPLLQRIDRTQRIVVVAVILVLAGLYGALFFIVKHADGIIRNQYAERRQAEETLREQYRNLLVLKEISQTILSSLELKTVLEGILEKVMALGLFDVGVIRLLDSSGSVLKPAASLGFKEPSSVQPKATETEGSATGRVLLEVLTGKGAYCIDDLSKTEGMRTFKKEGVQSAVVVPVRAEEQVLGTIQLGSRRPRKFLPREIDLLEAVGNQMGIAVQKARLYEQTRDQAIELEKANKMQADFTAMIAHDLRSPLTAVMSAATLLEDGLAGPINEEQWKWLAKVENQARILVALVNDFLDISKLEAGHIDLVKEEIDLNKLVQDSVDNYSLLAQDKEIRLRACVASDLPRLKADARRLDQVFANLISNAIKFTGKGGEIEVGAAQADRRAVKLWVKDSGVGIPADEIGILFEKYRQTTSGRAAKEKGTGLGLVICKMIVEAHGGRIWVESESGKGSTFTIIIPQEFASN